MGPNVETARGLAALVVRTAPYPGAVSHSYSISRTWLHRVAGAPRLARRRDRAFAVAAAVLALLPGCAASPSESGVEPGPVATVEIPRLSNLSELDPGFAAAVRDALAAVDGDPSNGAAVGALGRLYQAHRYVDQARRCYELAQQLDPSSPDWPYYLGFLAAARGAPEEAARSFERALELRPSYWAARVRLGNALLAAGDAHGAEAAFRAARAAAPGTPWGELGLGKSRPAPRPARDRGRASAHRPDASIRPIGRPATCWR